jgi:hypothetical protein
MFDVMDVCCVDPFFKTMPGALSRHPRACSYARCGACAPRAARRTTRCAALRALPACAALRRQRVLRALPACADASWCCKRAAFFGLSFKELLAAKHPTAWLQFERGALDEAAFFATFFADGRPVDSAGLRAAMSGAYTFVPGMESLLGRLAHRLQPPLASPSRRSRRDLAAGLRRSGRVAARSEKKDPWITPLCVPSGPGRQPRGLPPS